MKTRCGSVWLERHVRDVEAAGSSPVTSMIRKLEKLYEKGLFEFFFV